MSLLERCALYIYSGTVFILMIIRRYTSIWKMTTYRKNNLETWQQIERMESFLLEGEEEVAEVWNTMNWAGSSTTLWCRNQCPPSKFPLDLLSSTPITTGSKSTTPFSTWKKRIGIYSITVGAGKSTNLPWKYFRTSAKSHLPQSRRKSCDSLKVNQKFRKREQSILMRFILWKLQVPEVNTALQLWMVLVKSNNDQSICPQAP